MQITTLYAEIADMKYFQPNSASATETKKSAMSPNTFKNGNISGGENAYPTRSNVPEDRTSNNGGEVVKEMEEPGTPEFIGQTFITDFKKLTDEYQGDCYIFSGKLEGAFLWQVWQGQYYADDLEFVDGYVYSTQIPLQTSTLFNGNINPEKKLWGKCTFAHLLFAHINEIDSKDPKELSVATELDRLRILIAMLHEYIDRVMLLWKAADEQKQWDDLKLLEQLLATYDDIMLKPKSVPEQEKVWEMHYKVFKQFFVMFLWKAADEQKQYHDFKLLELLATYDDKMLKPKSVPEQEKIREMHNKVFEQIFIAVFDQHNENIRQEELRQLDKLHVPVRKNANKIDEFILFQMLAKQLALEEEELADGQKYTSKQMLETVDERMSKPKSVPEKEMKVLQLYMTSQFNLKNVTVEFFKLQEHVDPFETSINLYACYLNSQGMKIVLNCLLTLGNKTMNIDYIINPLSRHYFEQHVPSDLIGITEYTDQVTPEVKMDPSSLLPADPIAEFDNFRNIQTSDPKVGMKSDSDKSSKTRSQTPESGKPHEVLSEKWFCGSSSDESWSQLSNSDGPTSTTINQYEVGVENKRSDPGENSKTRSQTPEIENHHDIEKMPSRSSFSETSSDESSSQPSNRDGATSTTIDPSEPDSHEISKTRGQMPESETPHDIEKMPSRESFSESSSDESSSQPSNMDGAASTTVDPISYRINPKVDETRELVQATPVPSRLDPKLLHRHDVPDVHQTVPSLQPVLDPKLMSPDWLYRNRLMPGVGARPNPAPAPEGPEPPPLTGEALRRAMAQANYRTASMIHLQHQLDVPAMVEAGLYLDESDEDFIRCYECDLNVPRADWPADQDPREHHRQLSPNCRLVRCHHDESNGQPSWSPDGAESVRPPSSHFQQDLTVDGDDDEKMRKSDNDDGDDDDKVDKSDDDDDDDDGDKCVH